MILLFPAIHALIAWSRGHAFLAGNLPARVRVLVAEWVELHQKELIKMWETKDFYWVAPLVCSMFIIQIQQAKYTGGYSIWLRFNRGEEGVVELTDLIEHYPPAAPLLDPTVFSAFRLDEWPTPVWDCGFDVCNCSLTAGKSLMGTV